jgi:hypothetical protein
MTGIFVIVGLVVLGFLALAPLERTWGINRTGFVALFGDVGLLEKNSPVTVGGKEVGRVKSLENFTERGEIRVRVEFDVDGEIARQLKRGTRVRVAQASFLGNKYVQIEPQLVGEDLPKDDRGFYVVEAVPGEDLFRTVDELKDMLAGVAERAGKLLDRITYDVLSDENVAKIMGTVENADGLVSDTRVVIRDLGTRVNGEDGTLAKADALVADLRGLVADLKADIEEMKDGALQTLARADVLLENTDGAVVDMRATLSESLQPRLERLLDDADRLVVSTEQNLADVSANANRTLVDADAVLRSQDLFGALYELRTTLREARLLLVSLRADPSQVLFGGPGAAEPSSPKDINDTEQRLSGRPKRYGY